MRLFGIFSSFFQGTGVLKKAILSQQASILCEIMIGAISNLSRKWPPFPLRVT